MASPTNTRGSEYSRPRSRNRRNSTYGTNPRRNGRYKEDTAPFRYRKDDYSNTPPHKGETFISNKNEIKGSNRREVVNLQSFRNEQSRNINDINNNVRPFFKDPFDIPRRKVTYIDPNKDSSKRKDTCDVVGKPGNSDDKILPRTMGNKNDSRRSDAFWNSNYNLKDEVSHSIVNNKLGHFKRSDNHSPHNHVGYIQGETINTQKDISRLTVGKTESLEKNYRHDLKRTNENPKDGYAHHDLDITENSVKSHDRYVEDTTASSIINKVSNDVDITANSFNSQACNDLVTTDNNTKSKDCNDLVTTHNDTKSKDCNDLVTIDNDTKSKDCNDLVITDNDTKSKDCNDLFTTDNDTKSKDCNDLVTIDNDTKSKDCNKLVTTDNDTKSKDCNELVTTDNDTKSKDNSDLVTRDNDTKCKNCNDLVTTDNNTNSNDSNNLVTTDNDTKSKNYNVLHFTDNSYKSQLDYKVVITTDNYVKSKEWNDVDPTDTYDFNDVDIADKNVKSQDSLNITDTSVKSKEYNIVVTTENNAKSNDCNVVHTTDTGVRSQDFIVVDTTDNSFKSPDCKEKSIDNSAKIHDCNVVDITTESDKSQDCNIVVTIDNSFKIQDFNIGYTTDNSVKYPDCNIEDGYVSKEISQVSAKKIPLYVSENFLIEQTDKRVYIYDERTGLDIGEIHAQYIPCILKEERRNPQSFAVTTNTQDSKSGSAAAHRIIKNSKDDKYSLEAKGGTATSVFPLKTNIPWKNGMEIIDSEISFLSSEIIDLEEPHSKGTKSKTDFLRILSEPDEDAPIVTNGRSSFWQLFLCGSSCLSKKKSRKKESEIIQRIRQFFRGNKSRNKKE
ncbi:cysteine-rich, acidic integral membrane protein-like [Saccostrea echinata]|uniref:cysteine-rich, acidic integral membrane protein-like n=1 Tax=Saccostrea echinata TaxID=191078 RepID=UPI002A81E9C5|nr:cysteine-rich, acidic integral membrane protein-like [Saccostrea echinata]